MAGAIVVLDNHRSHYSIRLQEFLNENDVELLFLPPASSVFNPIETVWSVVKDKWRKVLMTSDPSNVGEGWMRRQL